MDETYCNEYLLNYNNELVIKRNTKREELEDLANDLKKLRQKLTETTIDISEHNESKHNYRFKYMNGRLHLFLAKYTLHRNSVYTEKVAKLNMKTSIAYLSKKGQTINANKLLPKNNRLKIYKNIVFDDELYVELRKASAQEVDQYMERIKLINTGISKTNDYNSKLKTKMRDNSQELSNLKELRRETKKELSAMYKDYVTLNTQYKKADKQLKKSLKLELDPKTKKQR